MSLVYILEQFGLVQLDDNVNKQCFLSYETDWHTANKKLQQRPEVGRPI